MRCRMAPRRRKPRRFAVTAGAAGQCGEASRVSGTHQNAPTLGRNCERVMGVAFGLFRLALRDRHAGARRQRQRQVPAGRCRDGVVGPASGSGQIPARQRGLGHAVSSPTPLAWAGA